MRQAGELLRIHSGASETRRYADPLRSAGTHDELAHGREVLLKTVDVLGRPLVVLVAPRMVLHRSRALVQLLNMEPGRDALMNAASELAAALLEQSRSMVLGGEWKAGSPVTLCPHRRSYVLQPYLVPAGVFNSSRVAVVAIERAPRTAAAEESADLDRYGLTQRQMEVARLLMSHYSTAEIAQALTISVHTARHHIEQVYRKMQVSGRRDLRKLVAEKSVAGG